MHSQISSLRILDRAGAVMAAGVFFALLKPFGWAEDQDFFRIGFWAAIAACWLGLSLLATFAVTLHDKGARLIAWKRQVLAIGIAIVPATLIAALLGLRLNYWKPDWIELGELVIQTVLVILVLEALSWAMLMQVALFGQRSGDPEPARSAFNQPDPPGGGLHIVPKSQPGNHFKDGFSSNVLCMQMEDHYVRVHSGVGSELKLMRFSDAVAKMENNSGMRVHRSWWVAFDAVKTTREVGRTAQIELFNGMTVPVSQPYLASLRERVGIETRKAASAS